MSVNQATQLKLYRQMLRIRMVEEAIAAAYPDQKMRTPVHLSIGQEAVAAAAGLALKQSDYAVSTHRSHAHYLAKGGALDPMIAELYGKVTGCSRGRGGSMHLVDQSVGFMGSTAIVGNTIPIGVGFGLSIQLGNEDKISCVFVGDGAIEEGVFYESLNFAVVRKLPVLFICENNLYSVYTPIEKRQPAGRKLHELARAIGAETMSADGYDVVASFETLKAAAANVRDGGGPGFVELSTYRWREHCGPNFDNDIGYRSQEEYEAWFKNDPIAHHKQTLLTQFSTDEKIFQAMESEISSEISLAFTRAEAAPFPNKAEAYTGEYAVSHIKENALCEV
ncbi:MAG: thiamine pyrophosphate-dependent dehydrogenase E1 component subunit alpha [Gammaproteobacteria bacterium]|nr:thiamine pyrophosphate-dependent dehydrogenase E1 component subunit alpha [Gammaproteobacteria bacterium]MCH9717057.1 thiamine pyrophosphate-dependent dehydrogenase E1 component subunit alpha [Gammaproteobacteria bacterium]MCH9763223.1 thiamine pyrophosphate-dependent dehydrogenase E1 component subunit alpha [Gammaproteobacteria bacterium]